MSHDIIIVSCFIVRCQRTSPEPGTEEPTVTPARDLSGLLASVLLLLQVAGAGAEDVAQLLTMTGRKFLNTSHTILTVLCLGTDQWMRNYLKAALEEVDWRWALEEREMGLEDMRDRAVREEGAGLTDSSPGMTRMVSMVA